MAGAAAILREIHRLRRHAQDLQAEIDRAPRLLKAQQAKIVKQEEALHEAHEALKHLKVALHDKEVTLKTTHQQIGKHQKQLNEATGKKEYDALQAEIASDKRTCERLEDDILECMLRIEESAARVPESEKAVQRAKEESVQFEKDAQARYAGLNEQLKQALAQLAETEATLSAKDRSQYDRLIQARGDDAMTVVQDRTCVACYTEITAQSYNELLVGSFVLCKSCGRILYLPE